MRECFEPGGPTWPLRPGFARDLYAGTASYYARYRAPYPETLIDDLRERTGLDGTGQLLDLACGTGQAALALAPYVESVVAVDQEPDMVDEGRRQAARAGISHVLWEINRAEDVRMAPGSVRLLTIGSAFHRLDRPLIAKLALTWLAPDGWLALLHSNTFWQGTADWQRIATDVVAEWVRRANASTGTASTACTGSGGPGRTHAQVLRDEGFGLVDERTFPTPYIWSLDAIVGFFYSTSVASKAVLGELADDFEADLRRALLDHDPSGQYVEDLRFAYTLARR